MQPSRIRAELKLREVNISALARSIGVSNASVHRAIDGIARSRRVEEAVAGAIEKSRWDVFGPNSRESEGQHSSS